LTGAHQETTMTTDEAARLHLYEQARAVLDESAADTLMNALPRDPDRFAKDDLASLGNELRAEFRTGNADLLRTLFFGMLASNATLVGLAFAAARVA
jgi:hypothetical protein